MLSEDHVWLWDHIQFFLFFELQIHKPYMIQEKEEEEKNCFNVSIIIFLLPTPIIKLHTNIKYNLVPQLNSSVILEQLQNSCKSLLLYRGRGGRVGRIKQTRQKVKKKTHTHTKVPSLTFCQRQPVQLQPIVLLDSLAIGPHTAMHSSIPNITLPHYSMFPVCSRAKLNSAKKTTCYICKCCSSLCIMGKLSTVGQGHKEWMNSMHKEVFPKHISTPEHGRETLAQGRAVCHLCLQTSQRFVCLRSKTGTEFACFPENTEPLLKNMFYTAEQH